MYLLSTVRQVNSKYVFLKYGNGVEDRERTKLSDIEILYEDAVKEMNHLSYTMEFTQEQEDILKIKYNEAKSHLEYLEQYIADNQDNPSVRRGLAMVCTDKESTVKKLTRISAELSGMRTIYSAACDEKWRLYEIAKQCESVMKGR